MSRTINIMGSAGVGKTEALLRLAMSHALDPRNDYKILFMSLEISREDAIRRLDRMTSNPIPAARLEIFDCYSEVDMIWRIVHEYVDNPGFIALLDMGYTHTENPVVGEIIHGSTLTYHTTSVRISSGEVDTSEEHF